jgi:SAM-dependent methyltransferase
VSQPDESLTEPVDPRTNYLRTKASIIREFYDCLGTGREKWIRRNSYYYKLLLKQLRFFIQPGQSVLDIGCGTGDLLAGVEPSRGVGVDISPTMVELAAEKYPNLTCRCEAVEQLSPEADETFDYITMVNVVGEMTDIMTGLQRVHAQCRPETRLIILFYNYLWEPLCQVAAALRLKLDNPTQNWLSATDLAKFLYLADFEIVKRGYRVLMPYHVPGVAELFNGLLAKLPLLNRLGFVSYVVARPMFEPPDPQSMSCSVIVPCKNEQDNVPQIVPRVPRMGRETEIVFVDDASTDETARRVEEQMAANPDRPIKLVSGPGEGKGAACRAGFNAATGDVLMILDADMTVTPEDLPAFFAAACRGKGEFVNGSRMVYPLAEDAMRPLNILGNKMFALLFSYLLEQPIKDTLCGTKVFLRRDWPKLLAARDYFGHVDRWGDYDLLFGAAKCNLKIVELPVHYLPRTAGETKMSRRLHNAAIMLRMCWLAFVKLKVR